MIDLVGAHRAAQTPGVRLLVVGRQGAGKGTQAVRLAAHFGVAHVSTGDMFRAALAAGTPFGKQAGAFMQRGELVPDAVVIGVVAERLAEDDAVRHGFVLDGCPRTRLQAEALQQLLAPMALDAAVDIEVPTATVLDRMAGRRVCRTCGTIFSLRQPSVAVGRCDRDGGEVVQREDDKPEAIRRRLELYERETGPLLDFYDDLGVLLRVDGVGDPDTVFDRVLAAFGGLRRLGPLATPLPAA